MLKIDLLPRHFAVARANKTWLAGAVVLLVVVLGFWFLWLNGIKADITRTDEDLAEVKVIADQVRELDGKVSAKEALLEPIQGKIDFIADADESGAQFWDRFHSINEYIWEEAQIFDFSITGGGAARGGPAMGGGMAPGMSPGGFGMRGGMAAPGGGTLSTVQFTARMRGTMGAGRFLLNLARCEDLTNIGYSGIPGGRSIEAAGDAATPVSVPGGVGGARAIPGGPGMGMPGVMPPGRGLSTGLAGEGEPGSPDELITLNITATLTEPISVPQPPRAVEEMGAGFGMGPGMGTMADVEAEEIEP